MRFSSNAVSLVFWLKMEIKSKRKKNILLIGSDSGLAKNLINKIIQRNDNLTTVSRRKSCFYNSKNHYQVDLSDFRQVDNFKNRISKQKFDVFIFLAGIFSIKKIDEQNASDIANDLMVNLTAPIILTVPVLRNMLIQGSGKLIFFGSSSSYQGFKDTSVYCSTKHGILGFSRSIAEETREKNILTTIICPGTINTKMAQNLIKNNRIENYIDPNEVSNLLIDLTYMKPKSMWQEEIILKRRSYK